MYGTKTLSPTLSFLPQRHCTTLHFFILLMISGYQHHNCHHASSNPIRNFCLKVKMLFWFVSSLLYFINIAYRFLIFFPPLLILFLFSKNIFPLLSTYLLFKIYIKLSTCNNSSNFYWFSLLLSFTRTPGRHIITLVCSPCE